MFGASCPADGNCLLHTRSPDQASRACCHVLCPPPAETILPWGHSRRVGHQGQAALHDRRADIPQTQNQASSKAAGTSMPMRKLLETRSLFECHPGTPACFVSCIFR